MKNAWEIRRLPEIAEYSIGLTYSPKDVSDKGTVVLRSSNIQNNELELSDLVRVACPVKDALKVREGDILMCSRNGSKRLVGKTALIGQLPEEMAFETFMTIIRSESNPFLAWFFRTDAFREQIGVGENTMINQITKYMLDAIRVPLPPLPEQQRIVSILDEAFEGITAAKANAEKNLQNARALFASHLQSVFSQRRLGWVEKPLAELCERITKGSSPKWQGIAYVDEPGILFVTSENVSEYKMVLEKPKYVEEQFNRKDKKSILRKGDVLTNIVGASIGRTAVFDRNETANINQAVCLIRCKPGLLNNCFLTYLLNSPIFKQVLHDNEVNTARANLSLTFFSQLPVPVPPISEQGKIVNALDTVRAETQRLASIYERKLTALEALKKSLLHQAFTGKL